MFRHIKRGGVAGAMDSMASVFKYTASSVVPGLWYNSKPNQEKTFFENYADHVKYLRIRECARLDEVIAGKEVTTSEILADLTMFEPLRDGHDYFDEIVSATVVPVVSAAAMIVLTGMAIWEGAKLLAITTGLAQKNVEEVQDYKAIKHLVGAAGAFLIAAVSLFKSVISLVTRPVVTVAQGWRPQDKNRFFTRELNTNTGEGLVVERLAKMAGI